MKKGKTENLVPVTQRTKDEAREISRKGGIMSGKKRQENAEFRKLIQIALNEEYKGGMTNAEAMVVSMIQKALEGDTKAFEIIRDTAGQKPVEKIEIGMAEQVAEQITDIEV